MISGSPCWRAASTGRGGFENAVYPWLRSWLPNRFKIQRNVDFEFDDGTKAQADFLIGNLWIETDYYRHHQGAGPQKATEDIQRERAIRQAGFDFGRYTDWEFDNDRAAIRGDIERMLGL